MKPFYILFYICFLVSFSSCSFSKNKIAEGILPASDIVSYGRTAYNESTGLELISSAANFGFSFKGKECVIYAYLDNANMHNYLQYELDGKYQKRIRVNGNTTEPLIITVPQEGEHTIWIYKATEALTGPIFVEKIEGENLKALKRTDAPVIEFIGNSITCGAAADTSEVPCGKGDYHDQHNAYYAYGPGVARALDVNFIMSCVSGIGMYRNWNSDGPTMPQVYEKTDFQLNSKRNWDFEKDKPAIVSIALGTNDFSNGDGKTPRLPFDSAAFVSTYIKFVQLVKSKYPSAQIVLLSSPMVNGERRAAFQNCITAVKQNIDKLYTVDKAVATFFFNYMQATGCSGHPTIAEHEILANELLPFFSNLLQKNK